jgi:sugar (pentulose or hexulose) kinase
MSDAVKKAIQEGKTFLGIEFGSTRIKAVLIDETHAPIASGDFQWENRYENGVWTYHMEDVWTGVQTCYARLAADVQKRFGVTLSKIGGLGISAMMHGYLPFDAQGTLLTPFRTWRNTITGQAAGELTELLDFNIPQRWSVAHLYQAILNGEEHVNRIDFLTTLAGYVHWQLTGEKVLGVGEASGMFPIDSEKCDYDLAMLDKFQTAAEARGWTGKAAKVFPRVLTAGEDAGTLTAEGAKLLDPTGTPCAGCPVAPPEGDAGTGMVATNAVAERTGNVSAGTSIFSMVVLERPLSRYYEEIDMVTTPTGKPVAMVHCNNCTNEINAWAGVFKGLLEAMGQSVDMNQLYTAMFTSAAQGERDCGGLTLYNYLSGEPVTGLAEGRPLLVRAARSADAAEVHGIQDGVHLSVRELPLARDLQDDEGIVQIHIGKGLAHPADPVPAQLHDIEQRAVRGAVFAALRALQRVARDGHADLVAAGEGAVGGIVEIAPGRADLDPAVADGAHLQRLGVPAHGEGAVVVVIELVVAVGIGGGGSR